MAKTLADVLPPWAAARSDGVIVIDPNGAYPMFLKALKVSKGDIDQYWLEVVFQCTKMEIQRRLMNTNLDPRDPGRRGGPRPLLLKIMNRPKWAPKNYPPGRGIWAATKGLEARQHYMSLAGVIPQ